jgi:hypothetical protein
MLHRIPHTPLDGLAKIDGENVRDYISQKTLIMGGWLNPDETLIAF